MREIFCIRHDYHYSGAQVEEWIDAIVKPLTDRIQELHTELSELRKDKARLDWAADKRLVDGIGDFDIDEATLEAIRKRSGPSPCSEIEWQMEWRNQFRIALDRMRAAQ